MNHLEELNELIDRAAKIAGSDGKLARSLGVPPQHVSNWRHGHKTCTPADQALMAHVAGLDPVETLARATVRQYEGKAKGDALMKALGKASLLTGAVLGSVGASAHQIFSTIQSVPSFTTAAEWLAAIYTMCISLN
ncbi:hypothetical protein GmRootV118_22980 [Variovorax sp. V118]|uniref:YdaS family helix-turn-helix protein n=1 Tax=Variovorax sp. V118 TaxID=3065954 RepID=UPI0034E8A4A0